MPTTKLLLKRVEDRLAIIATYFALLRDVVNVQISCSDALRKHAPECLVPFQERTCLIARFRLSDYLSPTETDEIESLFKMATRPPRRHVKRITRLIPRAVGADISTLFGQEIATLVSNQDLRERIRQAVLIRLGVKHWQVSRER
ncbi:MAG: hypothetical protein M3X11_18230 [Acidobacteriota bacterium]|nr:hypothetical protein [Acidobacteriota bacterium]